MSGKRKEGVLMVETWDKASTSALRIVQGGSTESTKKYLKGPMWGGRWSDLWKTMNWASQGSLIELASSRGQKVGHVLEQTQLRQEICYQTERLRRHDANTRGDQKKKAEQKSKENGRLGGNFGIGRKKPLQENGFQSQEEKGAAGKENRGSESRKK